MKALLHNLILKVCNLKQRLGWEIIVLVRVSRRNGEAWGLKDCYSLVPSNFLVLSERKRKRLRQQSYGLELLRNARWIGTQDRLTQSKGWAKFAFHHEVIWICPSRCPYRLFVRLRRLGWSEFGHLFRCHRPVSRLGLRRPPRCQNPPASVQGLLLICHLPANQAAENWAGLLGLKSVKMFRILRDSPSRRISAKNGRWTPRKKQ